MSRFWLALAVWAVEETLWARVAVEVMGYMGVVVAAVLAVLLAVLAARVVMVD